LPWITAIKMAGHYSDPVSCSDGLVAGRNSRPC
jgi:hypothetical protein